MRLHWLIYTFLGILASALSLFEKDAYAQLRSYSTWDEEARQKYREQGHTSFVAGGNTLLESLSTSTLVDVLSRRDFPVLRLAAYGALQERLPQLQAKYLVLLLVHAESIALYDAEFRELKASGEKIAIPILRSAVDQCSTGSEAANIRLILKAIPEDSLNGLLQAVSKEPICASGLAIVLEELCSRNSNWRETTNGEMIVDHLSQLEHAPGPPQLTFVTHFPFQQDGDALRHIVYLLQDPALEVPPVLIAISRFKSLLADSRQQLIAMATNKKLVEERLIEFSKRFK